MKLDRHGLKMHGIKAASHETNFATGSYGHHVQIEYCIDTGHIDARFIVSPCSTTLYCPEGSISFVAYSNMTTQEIADAIYGAVRWNNTFRPEQRWFSLDSSSIFGVSPR